MMSSLSQTFINFPVETALTLISGLCWLAVYVICMRVGFRDKIHAMPTMALAFNLFWELWYSYVYMTYDCYIQGTVNFLWFLFDLVILYTFIRFGRKEFNSLYGKKYFWPWTILQFVMAGFIVIGSYYAFAGIPVPGLEGMEQLNIPNYGCWYMAFIQNLVMSVGFITMLFNRRSLKGQSKALAILKCIGTLAPTICWGFMFGNLLIEILGSFCFLVDAAYIYLLYKPPFPVKKEAES